jgi:PrtD family type I secretion system ABC transporter
MKIVPDLPAELKAALAPFRSIAAPIVAISSVYNVLLLAGSFFMLLVYDDVLPSRSVPSLVSLFLMVATAYAFQALLDVVRGRMMVHVGTLFMRQVSDRVLDVVSRFELSRGPIPNGTQIVRDVDTIRGFLSGPGPLAIVDLPWIFVYLLILFVFHWSIGVLGLAGVFILIGLMAFNNRMTEPLALETVRAGVQRLNVAESTLRNAETLKALGMAETRRRSWHQAESDFLRANDRLAYISSTISASTKAFRMLLQSATLALGAFLVIDGDATGGIIIAASILTARALAPVEQVIANWKGMTASRQAVARLREMFQSVPYEVEPMGLERPRSDLLVQNLTTGPPGGRVLTIGDVSFRLQAGHALAIIGRSGSGKTTLARVLCGVWPVMRGAVRLDGATLDQWSSSQIAEIVGYVPQSIELFEGTIAENISRFDPRADREAILAAAKAADCHDMIIRLDDGYDYRINVKGGNLSAGQQQRIALARALYRDPFLIVLDEPNSNLDADGDIALGIAIKHARERGAIVVVIAHRPSILAHVSHVLVMNGGRVESFETAEVFEARRTRGMVEAQGAAARAPDAAAKRLQKGHPAADAPRPGAEVEGQT